MATARRSRSVEAPLERVWELVADPHHMPRWWPGVVRMEGVDADRFTQVFVTKKGRPVRIDFQLIASQPPGSDDQPARRSWEQELAGTPFERVLNTSVVEVVLEPADGRTHVTLAHRQTLRGTSKTGSLFLRRATGKKLDEALDGLERACA